MKRAHKYERATGPSGPPGRRLRRTRVHVLGRALSVEQLARTMAWAELRGRRHGLRGASSVWLAVWVVSFAYRRLRKMTAPEQVVVREQLRPGQRLVVTHFEKGAEPEVTSRRSRRAAEADAT